METKTQIVITRTRDGVQEVDTAELPDSWPVAAEAYVNALLDDPDGPLVEWAVITIGDLSPIEPPGPEPDVWLWKNASPGTTTAAQPRIELEAHPPLGQYVKVDMGVDVVFNELDASGKWMDTLAVTRGVGGEWKNLDTLAHLAVRTKGLGSLKARAGMGTRMGDPDKVNAKGEFVNKSKRIISPIGLAVGISYRFYFSFDLTSDENRFGEDLRTYGLRHQNLPANLATVDIKPKHSLMIHLGAIPGEAEGLTRATFENLEIRMTPKGA